jgi:hypothetical protein
VFQQKQNHKTRLSNHYAKSFLNFDEFLDKYQNLHRAFVKFLTKKKLKWVIFQSSNQQKCLNIVLINTKMFIESSLDSTWRHINSVIQCGHNALKGLILVWSKTIGIWLSVYFVCCIHKLNLGKNILNCFVAWYLRVSFIY